MIDKKTQKRIDDRKAKRSARKNYSRKDKDQVRHEFRRLIKPIEQKNIPKYLAYIRLVIITSCSVKTLKQLVSIVSHFNSSDNMITYYDLDNLTEDQQVDICNLAADWFERGPKIPFAIFLDQRGVYFPEQNSVCITNVADIVGHCPEYNFTKEFKPRKRKRKVPYDFEKTCREIEYKWE